MTLALWNHSASQLQWGAALGASLVAAIWDIRTHRIPNWLTFPFLLGGLAVAIATGGWAGLGNAAAGCLLMGVPCFLLFVFGGGGAGDAKMMGALGAWIGFSNAVPALLCVSVSGALLGLIYVAWRRRLGSVLSNMSLMAMSAGLMTLGRAKISDAQSVQPDEKKMLPMPYGLAIFIGMCLAAASRCFIWHA
jgi:prepilin peptidase CpaA